MNNYLYCSLVSSRAKELKRYSKALTFNLLSLMLRPVTPSLCLLFGAERRLEFKRYLLLRLSDILNQYIHCERLSFRYRFRMFTPHSIRLKQLRPAVVLLADDVKGVADMFSPDTLPIRNLRK